jgi:hypothetical protein
MRCSRALAFLVPLLVSLQAGAVIVDLDARDNTPENPVELDLPPGAYSVVPVDPAGGGAYTATNFWGVVEDCDEVTGGDCRFGWIWQYVYASDSIPETHVAGADRWATPELAFASAAPHSFDLYDPETVRFYFTDGEFPDNQEGVSFDVVLVPEPAGAALLLAGALALAATRLRPRALRR